MAESKTIELGPNARFVALAVVGLLTLVVNGWLGYQAREEAQAARVQGERNDARIRKVGKDVRDVQNNSRMMIGRPPVPETDDDQ